jgi:hypothetical protein
MGWVVNATPRILSPWGQIPNIQRTRSYVGPRADLDEYGENILQSPGFEPRTVRHVAICAGVQAIITQI